MARPRSALPRLRNEQTRQAAAFRQQQALVRNGLVRLFNLDVEVVREREHVRLPQCQGQLGHMAEQELDLFKIAAGFAADRVCAAGTEASVRTLSAACALMKPKLSPRRALPGPPPCPALR